MKRTIATVDAQKPLQRTAFMPSNLKPRGTLKSQSVRLDMTANDLVFSHRPGRKQIPRHGLKIRTAWVFHTPMPIRRGHGSASLKAETHGYSDSRRRRQVLARTPAVRSHGLDTNRRSVRIRETRMERRLAVLAGRDQERGDQQAVDEELHIRVRCRRILQGHEDRPVTVRREGRADGRDLSGTDRAARRLHADAERGWR